MVGGVAGNDHLRYRINVNCLSMDTTSHIRPMAVMRYPPHVVVAPAWQGVIAGRGKLARIRTFAYVANHGLGNHLLSPGHSIIAHHFAKPREIPQACIQAAAGKFCTFGINGDVGIVFGTETAPDPLR